MSTSSGSRSLRPLFLLIAAVAVLLAARAAVADKGGSYDPADALR